MGGACCRCMGSSGGRGLSPTRRSLFDDRPDISVPAGPGIIKHRARRSASRMRGKCAPSAPLRFNWGVAGRPRRRANRRRSAAPVQGKAFSFPDPTPPIPRPANRRGRRLEHAVYCRFDYRILRCRVRVFSADLRHPSFGSNSYYRHALNVELRNPIHAAFHALVRTCQFLASASLPER